MTSLDAAIRAEALTWVGTTFRHGASLKGIGVDCIHLVGAVLRAVGLLNDSALIPSYPPDWFVHRDQERLLDGLREHCDEVQEPWQVGDILVYRFGRAASHCGLYVGEGQIIHAATRDQVRCDPVDSAALHPRFVGGYRVRR